MAEAEAKVSKRGRPRKTESEPEVVTPTASHTPEPEVNVDTTVDTAKTKVARAKDAIVSATGVTAETKDQLVALAKGLGVAALDAGLVYLKDNLNTVNFGTFNGLVQSLGVVGLSELRNLVHGGTVSSDVFVEAVKTHLSEAADETSEAVDAKVEEDKKVD